MDDNEIALTPEERDALVNHVFDAIRAVAWADGWRERQTDQAFGGLSTAQADAGRKGYFDYVEDMRSEWHAEAAGLSNNELYGMLEKWIDRGDAAGMRHWRDADYQRILDEKAKGVETKAKVADHGRER